MIMNNIYDSAAAFNRLTQIYYEIVLGKKNKTITLKISFEKVHFYHLAGLQYIEDLRELSLQNIQTEKVFDKILSGEISVSKIESSAFYNKISDRVEYLTYLENIFDSNDTIFKYDEKKNIFTSKINGQYLLKNSIQNRNVFVVLDKKENCDSYFCRSFFPQKTIDYSLNQSRWTVLLKKKVWKAQNIEDTLYDYFEEKRKNKK